MATREAELRSQGYIALLGRDERSWGWNLVENVLIHNGESQGNYPLVNNAPRYQVRKQEGALRDLGLNVGLSSRLVNESV